MEIDNLKQFVQMVDIGSIQGAARHLGVSRSVLRRGLDALEAEVGAPLVHRDPSGVRLTAAGAVALARARALLEAAHALVSDARSAESEAWGVLRVREPVGMPLALQATVVMAARAAMPKVRIVMHHLEDPAADLDHPFDLMLHEGPAPDRNAWFSRVIMRARLSLVAARSYLEQRGTPATVVDLVGHDLLGWTRPGHPGSHLPLVEGGTVPVTPWFVSTDPQLLNSLARRGGGLVLAPPTLFDEADGGEELVPVLEDQVGGDLVFRVTTPYPAKADPRTRDSLAVIVAQLADLPVD